MAAKNKGGRPKMADEDKARNQLTVYLTDTQLADLAAKAAKQQMSTSQWLIKAAVRKLPRTVPEINNKAYRGLAGASNNLNQIARQLNSNGRPDIAEMHAAINALTALLNETRMELIGAQS